MDQKERVTDMLAFLTVTFWLNTNGGSKLPVQPEIPPSPHPIPSTVGYSVGDFS